MKWLVLILVAVGLYYGWTYMQESSEKAARIEAEREAEARGVAPDSPQIAIANARKTFAEGLRPVSDVIDLPGWSFSGATITEVTPDGVKLLHADGITRVDYRDLPKELREKYQLTADRAAAFAQARQVVEAADFADADAKKKAALKAQKATFAADEKRAKTNR
jgi:glycerol-3-phosphate cytidylyltransferase-like family protein